ncbi:MAG: hypothetical protein IT347_12075 [Candidatus Eisenbacteria bacterium]|nr:hypothetical protein [Candidatus Eisenbacteria bacterium]
MTRVRRPLPMALLACALVLSATAGGATARPILFPPLPNGVREVRDERDVSPYLAAWKAASLRRERAAARPATLNQQSWDARWYDLDLSFAPTTSTVSGTVRMKATVTAGAVSSADLDFAAGMVVDGATSGPGATTWSRAGDVLTLDLDRAYSAGETFDVTVTYHGTPTGGYFGFQMVNGREIIWSLSEAYGARTWWPCKDAPEDKADSVTVHFTAPLGLTTVSNGTLVSTVMNGPTVTANWSERYPIATYLVSIASYPYTVTTDWYRPSPADSMLLRFWNYPESVAGVSAVQAKVKDMIAAYAARMGEYPFLAEKYGHAEFPFGGGMEHQTCTSIGAFPEFVVAHELMHQWWGDLVTCRDFHHIWLNEGFATYGEALWAESQGGYAAYKADMDQNRYLGPGSVWVPDASNETRVFDSNLSYNKGSWVLHMLRHVLGEQTFFDALLAYRATWGYKSATTENFRDACEAVSGRDLDAFFQQWIYGEYYPQYRANWTSAPAGGGYDVTLTLEQTQSWQLFTMPVDVTVTTAGGETTFVVPDSLASQQFVLHVADAPVNVEVDRDGWILKTMDQVVANPTFQKSVLLVNGVDWATYGTELASACTDKAFWGAYGIDFWDTFAAPEGGYPATLPAPLGHGSVPGDVLGQYRNVIWLGNNYAGDLFHWQDSPVLQYLRAGGNLLLLSRQGETFLGDSLRAYLGVNWAATGQTLPDAAATRPGLAGMARTATQSACAVFDTASATGETSTLLRTASGFTPARGIGAIRIPAAGAGSRPAGGRFAFVSGRPYRWTHAQLQTNVTAILSAYFLEPVNLADADGGAPPARLAFAAPAPNPSSATTALRFSLPRPGRVRLVVMDVAGRRVRSLFDGPLAAGPHELAWDGRDEAGAFAPAGLYWARIEAAGETATRRLARVR